MEGSTAKDRKGRVDKDSWGKKDDVESMQVFFRGDDRESFPGDKNQMGLLINPKAIYIAGFKFYSEGNKVSFQNSIAVRIGRVHRENQANS